MWHTYLFFEISVLFRGKSYLTASVKGIALLCGAKYMVIKRCLLSLLFLLYGICICASAGQEPVRIRAPQSELDASHDYFRSLIELALSKSVVDGKKLPLTQLTMAPYMVQWRALEELRAGRLIDIYWAGTSIERERALRAIPIPLVKGLLGFRVFAIHNSRRPLLENTNNLNDLKKLVFCQGAHWPDTDIMLSAGLSVQPSSVYENMFRQVVGRRCDAFPRGVHEGFSEVEARQELYSGLELYTDTILYYPFPMFFFVNKSNEVLAQRLQTGLERAISDGSFDNHLKTHPVTRHLFPLESWINSNYIKIENPFLPSTLDTADERYWITPP